MKQKLEINFLGSMHDISHVKTFSKSLKVYTLTNTCRCFDSIWLVIFIVTKHFCVLENKLEPNQTKVINYQNLAHIKLIAKQESGMKKKMIKSGNNLTYSFSIFKDFCFLSPFKSPL